MFVITSRLSLLFQCPFFLLFSMLAFAFLKLHILRVRDIGCDRFNKEDCHDGKVG